MKRYGVLLLSIVIAFVTLASNLLLPASDSSALLVTTRTPTRTPWKPGINTILWQTYHFGSMLPGPREEALCKNLTSPIIVSEQAEVKQLGTLELTTCGWNLGSDVTATITKPDRASKTETLRIYGYPPGGITELHYTPTAFDPIGSYTVHFSNDQQALDVEFNVSKITEPGAVIIAEDREVQIYNFQPYENIRIFQFDIFSTYGPDFATIVTWRLNTWQDLQIASDGRLQIPIIDNRELYEVTYVVIGEETGEYNTDRGKERIPSILNTNTPIAKDTSLCAGASKSRMEIGFTARVTTRANIRKDPTTSASITQVLPKDTLFLVTDGPQCSNGYTWWYGITDNGSKGWVAESAKGTYLLKPEQ